MRTVVPSSEVAHLWAHQAQETARNANSSFSFSGQTLYSYSTPIGVIKTNGEGEVAYIVSIHRYSATTSSRHFPAMRRAIPDGATVFHVQYVAEGGQNGRGLSGLGQPDSDRTMRGAHVRDYRDSITDLLAKAKRARSNKAYLLEQAQARIQEATAYCAFFGVTGQTWTVEGIEQATADARARYQVERAARDAAEASRRAARLEEMARALPELLATWRSGGHVFEMGILHRAPVALRLSGDGSEVETSHGARVPLHHARRLFDTWLRGAGCVGLEGMRVGHYTLNTCTPDALTIGCHVIHREEAEHFASSLGWETVTFH